MIHDKFFFNSKFTKNNHIIFFNSSFVSLINKIYHRKNFYFSQSSFLDYQKECGQWSTISSSHRFLKFPIYFPDPISSNFTFIILNPKFSWSHPLDDSCLILYFHIIYLVDDMLICRCRYSRTQLPFLNVLFSSS